jgi:hypothetical protein
LIESYEENCSPLSSYWAETVIVSTIRVLTAKDESATKRNSER